MDKYIGIGGIITSLVVGILTCVVTWAVARTSQSRKKLEYILEYHPIVSRNVFSKTNKLSVYYDNILLISPCVLSVIIQNTGNCSISDPPIKIIAKSINHLIPGYIEDIPNGYENIWSLKKTDNNICQIKLDHINKYQAVKAIFYMDIEPNEKPVISCAMPDILIKEIVESENSKSKSIFSYVYMLILGFVLGILFYSILFLIL